MISSDSSRCYAWVTSPLGNILLVAQDDELTWLCLEHQRHIPNLTNLKQQKDTPLFRHTEKWLQDYFAGRNPDWRNIPLRPIGSTFQQAVWNMLLKIPYGQTVSYGELARIYTEQHSTRPCAQAIGGAVGSNPLAILIPCHRVTGANHTLGGYGGGLEAKRFLLSLESTRNATQFSL